MDRKNKNNILDDICANKRLEVARQKEAVPLSYLENRLSFRYPEKNSFKQALIRSSSGIIAEFKRRSPSKGWIHPDADAGNIVQGYKASGATAISCLTDELFFGGNFSDFKRARVACEGLPLLRKDFIIDEYQIYQSKVMGADVILLIAACLSREETFRFTEIAHSLDMEVLLEIHGEEELPYIQANVDVVGVNNRDLKTFVTDIRHTIDLAHKIPDEYVKISESGLSEPETVIRLRKEGFKGFLMGENFMKTREPGKALREFILDLSPSPSPQGRGVAEAQLSSVQEGKNSNTGLNFKFKYTTDAKNWYLLNDIAKELRSNQTEAENKLWQEIRAKKIGYKIRRQHIIDGYIADFVNLEKQVIIEVDGSVHLTEEQRERDEIRTQILNESGFAVIRFTNPEVLNNPRHIAQKIKTYLNAAPTPLPCGEGLGERLKIKVCGMKHPHNIKDLSTLPIDMIGLIFYEKSPRYAGDLDAKALGTLPDSIRKAGVFVNASKAYILSRIEQYGLQLVQLHGNESPAFCRELKSCGVKVIKAFPIREAGDLAASIPYENACDYFLFDTKTPQFGGSGKKFDWEILASYTGKTPFFLSGGIGAEDADAIQQIKHPWLYAIDLNSKFETAPGVKDINKLREFLRVKN
jgi:indole-3-glycerol phosphate synthase